MQPQCVLAWVWFACSSGSPLSGGVGAGSQDCECAYAKSWRLYRVLPEGWLIVQGFCPWQAVAGGQLMCAGLL
jgi:hypothetical protein